MVINSNYSLLAPILKETSNKFREYSMLAREGKQTELTRVKYTEFEASKAESDQAFGAFLSMSKFENDLMKQVRQAFAA